MPTNKSSKLSVSSRACDVAYRMKRVNELLAQANTFLKAVDPKALGENVHKDLENLVFRTIANAKVASKTAPKKKVHSKVSKEVKAKAKAKTKITETFTGFGSTFGQTLTQITLDNELKEFKNLAGEVNEEAPQVTA